MEKRLVPRVITKFDGKKITDQSKLKASDINVIVKRAEKTGVMPPNVRQGVYGDFTNIPSLEESFDIQRKAINSFMELPSQLRKLMDNDPTKLVNFINNPENEDLLLKYGIIEKKVEKNVVVENTDDMSDNSTNSDSTKE